MDPRCDEMTVMQSWAAALCGREVAGIPVRAIDPNPPVFFGCGEETSAEVLARATFSCESEDSGDRAVHHLRWLDGQTGLELALELIEFRDFPVLEWVLYITNTGAGDSPLLEDVQALDLDWACQGMPLLWRSRGTSLRLDDFQITAEEVGNIHVPHFHTRMVSGQEGRSSVEWLPFMNLDTGAEGLMVAIGWTGQWAAEITRSAPDSVHLRAGMEITRLRLKPGERIRTPRIALLYWRDRPDCGHNLLRGFMLAHHSPRCDGELIQAPACHGSWGGAPTAEHIKLIQFIQDQGLEYDYYWVDAGWYGMGTDPCPNVFEGDWGSAAGDWRVNPYRHPDGLRPISDAAHAAGMKFLLWVEIERALHGAPVTLEHPEWFLSLPGKKREQGENVLLDLGNPDARNWAVETVSGLIESAGIDCYRQDFNMSALPYWRGNDEPDRQGIHEIRHVEGLYSFWDELRARHPHLLIDNCASGGRRIDLETLGRSIPLWRNDYNCFPDANSETVQVHGTGLSCWVPLHATSPPNSHPGDTYHFRGALAPGLVFTLGEFGLQTVGDDYPWEWHRKMLADYYRLKPFWYGEYYLLTSCSTMPDAWIVYQLHRPDLDAGAVVAFRREGSPLNCGDFALRGLHPEERYTLEDLDSGENWVLDGSELDQKGLRLRLERRSSRVIVYKGQA